MLERVSFSGDMLLRATERAGGACTRGRRNGGGAVTGFDQIASELAELIRCFLFIGFADRNGQAFHRGWIKDDTPLNGIASLGDMRFSLSHKAR